MDLSIDQSAVTECDRPGKAWDRRYTKRACHRQRNVDQRIVFSGIDPEKRHVIFHGMPLRCHDLTEHHLV